MIQDIAWMVSIIPILIMVAIFSGVFASSGAPATVVASRQEGLRKSLFLGFLAIGIPLGVHTLAELPYTRPASWSGPALTVEATGRQWSWDLSRTDFKVGEPVEFRVTSADVNHGFAIYDASRRVVAQTQAMPGYVNTLRHRFTAPGTYTVMCLEFCGAAHHAMTAELHVAP